MAPMDSRAPNSDSRTRSLVGRVPASGTSSRSPRAAPAMILVTRSRYRQVSEAVPRLHSMDLFLASTLDDALGAKAAAALRRAFGMETVADLVEHNPRRYASLGELTPILDLPVGETVTIVAEVLRTQLRRMRNRGGAMLEVVIGD